jgi:single-strand DNA-binding protein
MPNVNKVILMGVLGRDPETKNFPTVAALRHSVLQLPSTGKIRPLESAKKRQNGTESAPTDV